VLSLHKQVEQDKGILYADRIGIVIKMTAFCTRTDYVIFSFGTIQADDNPLDVPIRSWHNRLHHGLSVALEARAWILRFLVKIIARRIRCNLKKGIETLDPRSDPFLLL
jgi:hypothetical protein